MGSKNKRIAKWLNENGFTGRFYGGYVEEKVTRFLIGRVLGHEDTSDGRVLDVEFNEDTTESFMLTCIDARDCDRFDVEDGDEVAVLEFNDGDAYVIDRKLTKAQVVELELEAIAEAEEEARLAEEAAVAKAARTEQAHAYMAGIAAGGGIKAVRVQRSYLHTVLEINEVVVPSHIAEEVLEVIRPELNARQEAARSEARIKYLKDHFTPEQLETAVAAYHAA